MDLIDHSLLVSDTTNECALTEHKLVLTKVVAHIQSGSDHITLGHVIRLVIILVYDEHMTIGHSTGDVLEQSAVVVIG